MATVKWYLDGKLVKSETIDGSLGGGLYAAYYKNSSLIRSFSLVEFRRSISTLLTQYDFGAPLNEVTLTYNSAEATIHAISEEDSETKKLYTEFYIRKLAEGFHNMGCGEVTIKDMAANVSQMGAGFLSFLFPRTAFCSGQGTFVAENGCIPDIDFPDGRYLTFLAVVRQDGIPQIPVVESDESVSAQADEPISLDLGFFIYVSLDSGDGEYSRIACPWPGNGKIFTLNMPLSSLSSFSNLSWYDSNSNLYKFDKCTGTYRYIYYSSPYDS